MKKIIITLALVAAAATSAFAQASVGAGYLNSTSTTKVGDNTSKGGALNGFYAGADYSVALGPVAFTPGIYFSYLSGKKTSNLGSIASASGTTTEMYLSVPMNFSYGIDLGSSLRAFVYAGPTLNLGCSATYKAEASALGASGEKTIDLYGDNSNYGRFDLQLGGGIGVDIMKMIRISAGYNYGMLDRNSSDNISLHRSEMHVGAAFLF